MDSMRSYRHGEPAGRASGRGPKYFERERVTRGWTAGDRPPRRRVGDGRLSPFHQ